MAVGFSAGVSAQVGEHRSELSVGVNGGYVMSNVGFNPSIPQKSLGGISGGLTVRYTCEKYFNSICALVGEVNYTQTGWKEDILTAEDMPVINQVTGLPEEYQRRLNYIQMPLMARMGWGRERKGLQFFCQLGPQLGLFMSDKAKANFDWDKRNTADRIGVQRDATQDSLPIQRKFDYGIVGGAGMEIVIKRRHSIMLEGRYYFGLGNIFKDSKRDFFAASRNNSIEISLKYMIRVK